jgi:hypothetical protein
MPLVCTEEELLGKQVEDGEVQGGPHCGVSSLGVWGESDGKKKGVCWNGEVYNTRIDAGRE